MTLTPSQTRAFLRRALALVDGYLTRDASEGRDERAADFLADVEAAMGVESVCAVVEALTPKRRGRGNVPDKTKRKSRREADRMRIDKLSASVAGSCLSREDFSDPPARSNAYDADVDQIAAVHTLNALRFQQMSL